MSVTAIILAGGRGTRIAELFPDIPKPLVPAAGQPFLYWVTSWLASQGIDDIVYSTGYRAGQIHDWVDALAPATSIRLRTRAEAAPLGTAGAVRECLDLCQDTVLVVNGDSLTMTTIAPALQALQDPTLDGAIMGTWADDTSRYGSLEVADGLLRKFHEKIPGQGLINCGISFFRKSWLESIPAGQMSSLETDAIPRFLAGQARIAVIETAVVPPARQVAFLDIGTPQTVVQASAFIEAHHSLFPPLPKDNG